MNLRGLQLLALAVMLAGVAAARSAPEWLQPLLDADTKALGKGSHAVQLVASADVRYTSPDRVRRIHRGAVRALTNSGRTAAVCGYRYDADTEKILAARAWIVAPDGKTATAFPIREFTDTVTKLGSVYWDRERVLGFDGAKKIQVGGVLAWEFEVESQAGIWDSDWFVMPTLPTHLSRFEVTPPPNGKLEWHALEKSLGPPQPGELPGALRWQWHRLQPMKPAEAPPGFIPRSRHISVRAVPADGAEPPRSWAGLARQFANVIEPRLDATADVKTKAAALAAAKPERWDRIRALTEFVQREITYVGIKADTDYLAGYRPHAPADVLRHRYGDCKDKSALLVAMLRSLGERAFLVLVSSGNPKAIDPDWPAARFNHAIVAIHAAEPPPPGWPTIEAGALGSLVLFDPTDAHTPLGLLSESDQGGFGLVVAAESTGVVALPVSRADANRHELRVRVTVDERGNATVQATETSRGSRGVALHARRSRQGDEGFKPELERRLHDTLAVFDRLEWQEAWDPTAAEWRLAFSFDTPGYARRAGEDLRLVSPQVVWASPRLTPWKTKQSGGVWFPARHLHKEVRLALPANAAVEELPADLEEKVGKATCHLRYRRDGKSVVFVCDLKEQAGYLDYEAYEARRLLLQRIEEAERRRIVFRVQAR